MIDIEELWRRRDFSPNTEQREAILHTGAPLYLTAGPGSGKTRVLLWRTVNLIVNHGVQPREIYLSTFTEKAANQLREGLRDLLDEASQLTNCPYDLGEMYVGTVHSLCQRIAADRAFSPNRARSQSPVLLDELSQYFYLFDRRQWDDIMRAGGFDPENLDDLRALNEALGNGDKTASRHKAVIAAISLFNRLSEECLEPPKLIRRERDESRKSLFHMYAAYLDALGATPVRQVDFSLLQQDALRILEANPRAGHVFKHVIIDEYQDTNTVQERIFFALAAGHKNLCVVGDDDQALYRFRGATVENFVDFPNRCHEKWQCRPRQISLARNYRSRANIVQFYTDFMDTCDWSHKGRRDRAYRVDKQIVSHSKDRNVSVVASTPAHPDDVCAEIAALVRELIDAGKVDDPNKIAFLFPSLKSTQVQRMKEALEHEGLQVYAPRAGCFLEVEEATAMLGLMLAVLGRPPAGEAFGLDAAAFNAWLDRAEAQAEALIDAEPQLAHFIKDRKDEIKRLIADYDALVEVAEKKHWDLESAPPDFREVRDALSKARNLSEGTRRTLGTRQLQYAVERRARDGNPYLLRQIITRLTSLDWHVLDLFYRLCGFQPFIHMFDLAEFSDRKGKRDEGPICNLALLSNYLARFLDERGGQLMTAGDLKDHRFQRRFFSSYLFALFRLGESEYEDEDDPFPRGRIPFLTIHQSKGLEFPVVVLGNPRKDDRGPQFVEKLVNAHLASSNAREPLDKMAGFDAMRMFYVALSRAQNLLVIAHFEGRGQHFHAGFAALNNDDFPRIPDLNVKALPAAPAHQEERSRNYSYTGDYMFYNLCPRRYMVFRHYGFASSTTQTMMFGSLVHRTIDDLHQMLIDQRSLSNTPSNA